MSTARESAPIPGFPAFVHSALQAAQYRQPDPASQLYLVSVPFLGPTMPIDVDWRQYPLPQAAATIGRAVTLAIISRAVATVARGEQLPFFPTANTPESIVALQLGLWGWIESSVREPDNTDSEFLRLLHTHVVRLVGRCQKSPVGWRQQPGVFDPGPVLEAPVHLFVPGFPGVSTWGQEREATERLPRMVVACTVAAALEPDSKSPGMFLQETGERLRLAIMDWAQTQAPKQLSQAFLE